MRLTPEQFAMMRARVNAAPVDPNWQIRSMEIHCGELCRDCGENVPTEAGLCEECEIERLYD